MKVKVSYRILVVGCGELGSRHLQAVAVLPQVREVDVVDPRPEALSSGQQRLSEVQDRAQDIVYRWFTSLNQASPNGDLCIVATQAEGRCHLVKQIACKLGYRSFLLEKVVAQSTKDYEDLLGFSENHGLSAWVNCKTRAYPFHKRARARIDSSEPILFSVVAGNQGLATNGVHSADLFVFHDGSRHLQSAGSRIDPVLHPSKRGDEVFDLSGTLHGYSEKGSHMTISYARDHMSSEYLSIAARRYRCVVDHMTRWAWESDAESEWNWRPVPLEGNLLVSNMTRAFAVDILTTGACELPTLAEAFPAHRFVLDELLPHFNRLLGRSDDSCPVT